MDVVVKEFDKFAVFFILCSVYDNFIGVDCRRETAPPGVGQYLAGGLPGPDRRGGGEVPGDGWRGDQLHHLAGQGRQRQGGRPGQAVAAGPRTQWHHCRAGGVRTPPPPPPSLSH